MPLSEFDLIRRYFAPFQQGPAVVTGIGDDCAVLSLSAGAQLCTSIDTLVAGVHFPVDADPAGLGWRCLAAAISDLGACGAKPLGFCLALTLPEADENWLAAFSEGLSRASEAFAIPLCGGDTTRGPLTLSLQVMGEVASGCALLRGSAVVDDELWVTGMLGDARAALDLFAGSMELTPAAAEAFRHAYYYPQPPMVFARALPGLANAAIDISDGLLADLGHVLASSALGAELWVDKLPLSEALRGSYDIETARAYALSGGDDYQLCFSAPASAREQLLREAQAHAIHLTCIGQLSAEPGLRCLDDAGRTLAVQPSGYQHFS